MPFAAGPHLKAAIEQLREQERAGKRMGFWIGQNAAERLAAAINADLQVGELSEEGPAKGLFRFGPHARLELMMLHLDANEADVLERSVQRDLAIRP